MLEASRISNGRVLAAWIPAGLGAYALVGGIAALLGWALDIHSLADWDSDGIYQLPNTALGAATAGAAIILLWCARRRAGAALASFAGLIGAATVFEYLSGIDLGIDRLMLYREWGQKGTLVPGRMGMPAATSLSILGGSIVLLATRRAVRFAVAGGLLAVAISSLSLIGYIFGADTLYTIPKYTVIAQQTSTMILALGLALIATDPIGRPIETLFDGSSASMLVRRALPGIILLPIFLGWLRVQGQDAGLYDTAFGSAVLVLVLMALLSVLLLWSAAAVRAREAEVRESREELVDILGSITDAVLSFDANWTIVFLNEQAERRFGKRLAEVVGRNYWDLFPDAEGSLAHAELHRAMAERVGVEYEVFCPPGQRWFAERAYPTPDGGVAVYSQDVTERKGNEEEARRLAAELRDADRRKDEFLATLAHELRNPLAPVRNSLEVLKRAPGNPAVIEQTRSTMERQVHQMVRLIDDLLDLSRITRDKLVLRRERVELGSVIQHAIEACAPLVGRAKHELTATLPPEPIYLQADPVRLAQVFGNILTNACKYTEPGGSIGLTVERQGGDAVVAVRDTGLGIPPEMLPRVFEMFTQVDQTLERSQGGLGIGLTLVKRLVELHEGTVSARSEGRDRGSEFEVRLPILIETPPRPHPAAPVARPAPAAGRRILVVDDNRDAASSLAMLLELTGNEVVTAHDGAEAVEVARTDRPEVILLDIGLPKMNGYDACRAIRQQAWGKGIVIIALTGWGQDEDRRKSREAGFDGHLVKPVDHAALMQLLDPVSGTRPATTPLRP